jgi:predicted solute-binding protein
MDAQTVPPSLRERLGADATLGLAEVFDSARSEWVADVTELTADRFERRLTEEIGGLRVEIVEQGASLRQELADLRRDMTAGDAALRLEMTAGHAALRQEMAAGHAALRQEVNSGDTALREATAGVLREISDLRLDMTTMRFELLKWSFVFWVGQVLAVAAILGLFLRRS